MNKTFPRGFCLVIILREIKKNRVFFKMSKYSSICDLTESDRQKAISELNESDDFESRISSLRKGFKLMLTRWRSQRIKYPVLVRQPITERL